MNFFYEKVSRIVVRECLGDSSLCSSKKIVFTTKPSFELILRKIRGDLIIYLNWRSVFTKQSSLLAYIKDCRQLLSLFISDIVFTNDNRTKIELECYGINSCVIPFFIDFDRLMSVRNYLISNEVLDSNLEKNISSYVILILGDNDRDDELIRRVADLAPSHFVFIRITRNSSIQSIYNASSRVKLLVDVDLKEYVSYIMNSSLVWLPVRNDIHAAGQTSCLEALSFGKKVISNSKKLRSIFLKDANFRFYRSPNDFNLSSNLIASSLLDIMLKHIDASVCQSRVSVDYSNNLEKFDTLLTAALRRRNSAKSRRLIIL